MTPIEIDYTTENPAKRYAKAIDMADNAPQLYRAILPFERIADDALKVAKAMTKQDFHEFRKGLKAERKGQFAGVVFSEQYGAIIMPAKMMIASLVEDKFKVPWGLAVIRCEEEGWPQLNN
jgi:hypothetical protein